jgi:predicted RNA-binding protein YlqC (UPF0109 family)
VTDRDVTEPDGAETDMAERDVVGVGDAGVDAAGLDEAASAPLGSRDRYDDDDDDRDEIDDSDEGDQHDDDANRAPAPVALAVLEHITRSVVDDPEAVDIAAVPLRAGRVRLAVRVAPNDFGRLIGRRGRVAAAVRTLVGAAAVKDGVDVEVEFVE